jgi:hypothetical protein
VAAERGLREAVLAERVVATPVRQQLQQRDHAAGRAVVRAADGEDPAVRPDEDLTHRLVQLDGHEVVQRHAVIGERVVQIAG